MDAAYVLRGTSVSQLLAAIVPPRLGLDVLEAGSGSGKLSFGYFLGGANITMVEFDPEVILYSQALFERVAYYKGDHNNTEVGRKSPDSVIRWRQESLFDLSKNYRESFDLVFSEGTTHHWPREDPRRAGSVKAMADACKPGGTVVVIGSNAHCPEMMLYAEQVSHTYADMPPKQTPLTQDELDRLLRAAGLEKVRVVPVDGSLSESKLIAGWGVKP